LTVSTVMNISSLKRHLASVFNYKAAGRWAHITLCPYILYPDYATSHTCMYTLNWMHVYTELDVKLQTQKVWITLKH